jgi:alkaline phosphatase D
VTTRYQDLDLDRMVAVGAVEPTRARLWLRAPAPGPVELVIGPETGAPRRVEFVVPDGAHDLTAAFDYPDDFPGEPPLAPDTTYTFRLGALGAGRFVTPPAPDAPPKPLRLALMSCHEPFDAAGEVHDRARRMLRIAGDTLRAPDVAFAILAGDQVYADHPPRCSLFEPRFFAQVAPPGRATVLECTRAEVRALYHRRYRAFWALPEWRRFQAQLSTHAILDDHEIVDNWGSVPEHGDPRWSNLRDGALDAFHDYQASRALRRRGLAFDHGFRWGRVAVYLTDLRSQRRALADGTMVLGEAQQQRLATFLAQSGDADVLLLVVSVPVLHLAEAAATLVGKVFPGDAADRWTYAHALRDRDRLMRDLHAHSRAHPRQRVIMLAGDIHVGCAFRFEWSDGTPAFLQLTSSAVSNVLSPLLRLPAKLMPHTVGAVWGEGFAGNATLLPPAGPGQEHPYAGLNFGLVDLDPGLAAGDPWRVRFRLIGDDGGEVPAAREVYDTGWV